MFNITCLPVVHLKDSQPCFGGELFFLLFGGVGMLKKRSILMCSILRAGVCRLRRAFHAVFRLTDRCWNSQARIMFVADLGKIPRFFCRFILLSSESQSSIFSPEPIELAIPSPMERENA